MGGKKFGRYELLLKMGAGGMATLFLGRLKGPKSFEKYVAIKTIHDHLTQEKSFVDMFLDEARISGMIQHPNVVQIFDMDTVDGVYYIAMEYVHGQDLAQVLRAVIRSQNRNYKWWHAARIVADAAAGLHAAHELKTSEGNPLNLVHRDVSPQNLLVSYDGHVKVVDFGVAFASEKLSKTQTGTVKGKLAYMSPEQCTGQPIDRRTDVFALGIVLYESVCLRRLFREENEAFTVLRVSQAQVPKPSESVPDIDPELEKIILKALAKDPNDRFSTAQELQRALEKLLAKRDVFAGPQEVGTIMHQLFRDRKMARDQQVKEASQQSSISQAVGVETTGGDSLPEASNTLTRSAAQAVPIPPETAEPSIIAPVPRQKRSVALPLLLGLAVILTIVGAAFFIVRSLKNQRRNPPAAGPAPMAAAADGKDEADKEHVELTFFVTPKEAKLFLGDKEQAADAGKVKRVIKVKRGEELVRLKVVADGYSPKMGTFVPVQPLTITLNLLKEGSAPMAGDDTTELKITTTTTKTKRRRTRRRRRRRNMDTSTESSTVEAMEKPRGIVVAPRPRPRTRPRAMDTRRGGVGAVDEL